MGIRISSRDPETQQENVAPTPFRVFEDIFNDWVTQNVMARQQEAGRPNVDILERDNNFILHCELPGVSEKDVELKLDGKTLTIRGERKREPENSGYTYHRVEGYYGSFSRSFDLPDSVDMEKISAKYSNGILEVTVPQKSAVRPRNIEIQQG